MILFPSWHRERKGRVYAAPSAGEFVAPVVGRARDDHQPLVQRHPGLHAPPEQWALFKTDPEGLAKRATEECLRYDAPVKSIQRLAAQDVDMRGKTLRKDDRIRWFITSANRDPEVFANPETFDITRDPNPHVAFGNGVHHCLGATLARLEGQEAFKALAQRFPNLHVEAETFEYQPSIAFRSVKSLPVAFN